jgi:hypothetical protein
MAQYGNPMIEKINAATERYYFEPTNAKLVRDGDEIKGTWGIPYAARATERFEEAWNYCDVEIYCVATKNYNPSKVIQSVSGARNVTGDHIWVRDLGVVDNHTQPFDPDAYHPKVSGRYLTSMAWTIIAISNNNRRFTSSVSYSFKAPDPPKFSKIEYDSSEKTLSANLSIVADDDHADARDMCYRILRTDNFNSNWANRGVAKSWTTVSEESFDVEFDVEDADALVKGQWIKIEFEAYSRGIAGDSSVVAESYIIGYPAMATITAIKVSDVTSSAGIVNVLLNTNATENNPVDTVKLQVLRNTTNPTVETAKLDTNWVDVENAVDNGNCKGLVDTVQASMPSIRGRYVYYRLVTAHGDYTLTTDPVKADALIRTSHPVEDDDVVISIVESGDDGESIRLVLGWNNDDSTGTEISWSDNPNAWESNEQPTTYDVTWSDAQSQVSGMDNSASFYIRGLEEGKNYYIKARRYLEADSERTYSLLHVTPDAEHYPFAPHLNPSNVVLLASTYIKRGFDLDFSWSFDSTLMQKGWILYHISPDGTTKTAVAEGEDSFGTTTVKASVIQGLVDLWETTELQFSVSITTGGKWAESEAVKVTVLDPISLAMAADSHISAKPVQFYVKSDNSGAKLVYKVLAKGISSREPDKRIVQLEGDCVYSDAFVPDWYSTVGGGYSAIVELPDSADFRPSGDYQVQMKAVDESTGVESDEISFDFSIDWAIDPYPPDIDATVVSVDKEARTVTITPVASASGNETDYFEVYRITPDGADLLADFVDFGGTVVDMHAPFSNNVPLCYRLATRTIDGAMDWIDLSYDLKCYSMRFDWGDGKSLELPYNPEVSDSYSKDFESKSYIDGTVSGHWNGAISRSSSLKTKLLRLSDPEQITRLVELGRYPGPVFVRLPNGSAFTANVTLSSIDNKYREQVVSASLSVEQIGMVDEFRASEDDIFYPSGHVSPDRSAEFRRQQILRWDVIPPASGQEFTLNEDSSGRFEVTLQSSKDSYGLALNVPATISGSQTIVLGEFGETLTAYINSAPEGTSFLLKAFYNNASS